MVFVPLVVPVVVPAVPAPVDVAPVEVVPVVCPVDVAPALVPVPLVVLVASVAVPVAVPLVDAWPVSPMSAVSSPAQALDSAKAATTREREGAMMRIVVVLLGRRRLSQCAS